ncbi:hypothetical protein GCM10011348_32140 [Marinobacterium nitratireducens]|uniref:Negative regulator of flagellin synthesis n=1 Tax=Marinobacterium nitratireducens TaxID=518897 RepID=A0A917ZKC7_9GAMM|nr:flagellar biosynthesis anti-sigma factor FlgM [Marinobacterium nitratireducens]GGO84882.1 hypothetical protein GCM10011348_32140 [Marinobacterium nitratireducens]
MAINFTGLPPHSQANSTRAKTDNDTVTERRPAAQAPSAGSSDEVRLSEAMKALQAADKRLADTPEVDEKRVAELRAAIESGSYQIDSQRVAERMLDFESLLD